MSDSVQPPPGSIRVLLVDDHPAVRMGLAMLLASEGIEVCGEAAGFDDAMELAGGCAPCVAVVDLSLAGRDGLDVVAGLLARGVRSLVYSMHDGGRHVQAAFAAGALGYVAKREMHRVLVEAIRSVAEGRRFASPEAAAALAGHVAMMAGSDAPHETELSEQERQVYRMLGEGEGTIEIAAALRISTRTVDSYYARIQAKLGLRGMRDLRRHAISHLRSREK